MATIRKRNNKYQAQVRIKGFPPQSKSFSTQAAAKSWARRTELSMENGSWIDTRDSRSLLINNLTDELVYSFERFGLEVAGPKMSQLNQIKEYFRGISVHSLTLDEVLDFAAWRKNEVCASTLQTQVYYLRQIVEIARIDTKIHVVDQAIAELSRLRIISGSRRRDRRLSLIHI